MSSPARRWLLDALFLFAATFPAYLFAFYLYAAHFYATASTEEQVWTTILLLWRLLPSPLPWLYVSLPAAIALGTPGMINRMLLAGLGLLFRSRREGRA